VPIIPMPTTADLGKLKTQAITGSTSIAGSTAGNDGQASVRIEFVALDLNLDGDSSDADEGFMKVYQAASTSTANLSWVMADTIGWAGTGSTNGVRNSANCGHSGAGLLHGGFATFADLIHVAGTGVDSKTNAPGNGLRRCYLGGSDILNPGGLFSPADARGAWLAWPGIVDPRVTAVAGTTAPFLWPINRVMNPNFRGVIYVEGKVAVSGRLRGRVTLAASGDIIIADDITYVTNPATATCADILGLFSGDDIVVADNLLNDPIPWLTGKPAVTWDDTMDEFINGFVLALDIFTVQNYDQGSTSAQSCLPSTNGRGCLFLTGGIIQKQRGAVGLTSGQGYIKRYSYDACGLSDPPPYFPTTGRFARGHYFEVEPTNFDIASYWSLLIPH
jgi:hypothetical protein